jgi:cobalamin biosynthesis protein CobT
MPAISDIFTPSFAFSLAICLLLTGLIAVYFTQKVAEQNHKMTSMLELVSTLANEVNLMRDHVFRQQQHSFIGVGGSTNDNVCYVGSQNLREPDNHIKLISVSDDEAENDEDDDEDEDEDDEEDEDEDEDEDEEDEEDANDEDVDDEDADEEDTDNQMNNFDFAKFLKESGETGFSTSMNSNENLLNVEELTIVEDHDITLLETSVPDKLSSSEVKNIDVVLDYKKASLAKLKSIVVEKNLVDEKSAAKMKKPELLKLLEDYV